MKMVRFIRKGGRIIPIKSYKKVSEQSMRIAEKAFYKAQIDKFHNRPFMGSVRRADKHLKMGREFAKKAKVHDSRAKTAGVIGLGAIAAAVAAYLRNSK